MNKAFTVARWEYLEKVKSKTFIIGLLVTPALMLAMGFLPMMFATQEDSNSKVIGIVDRSGKIAKPFTAKLEESYTLLNGRANYVVRTIGNRNRSLDDVLVEAKALVMAEEIEGFCVIGEGLGADSVSVEYHSRSIGDVRLAARIEETLRQVIAEQRIQHYGLSPTVMKDLGVRVDLNLVKLSKEGEKETADFMKVFLSAFTFEMMMFLLIMFSGQLLVRSVIEEKSNRIIEVLVSSASPTELMAGKVLGLSGLGFTQMAFWGLIGVAISTQTGHLLFNPVDVALLVVYFVLGYLFYAAVFITAGAPLNSEQEAQQITSYLTILLVMPMMLALPVMKTPDAPWIKVLSFVPFLTPTMMALRVPIQMPEVWELLLSIVIMVASIVGAMFVAGKVFRIGILSTGKTPGIAELIRWVKAG